MNPDVSISILAMDAYNRRYGIELAGAVIPKQLACR
jgi:hypothetical protein